MTKEEVEIVNHMIAVALRSEREPPQPQIGGNIWIHKKAMLAIWNDPTAVRMSAPINEADWVSFVAGSFDLKL